MGRFWEEFRMADIIIEAICKVGNISYYNFITAPKNVTLNTLRGICCVMAWEYKVHARRMARLMRRTRGNILNQQRTYRNLLVSKDKMTVELYNKVRAEIEEMLHKEKEQ